MKVCILSMQKVQNFGSLLQSYALKRTLEYLGHSVSFIDIEPSAEDNQLLIGSEQSYSEEYGKKSPWGKLKKVDRYLLNRIVQKLQHKQQFKVYEAFRRNVLQIDEKCNDDTYDCCVIGSDEVFNCMQSAHWGFTSQLHGNVRQADRVVTYAASCGATNYEQVPEAMRKRIAQAYKKVAAFSVRDGNTRDFTLALTDKVVEEHLDPVLIYDFSKEVKKAPDIPGLPDKYCIIYAYSNRIYKKQDIVAIKSFCKTHGMTPITIGGTQRWIKNHFVLEPFQVLKVFENAEFVVTDTFHGTIFSAKYAKKFAIMTRSSNVNKLQDLIHKLHLEKHHIRSTDQLQDVFSCQHDLSETALLLKQERERTIQYLKMSVQ